MKFTEAVQIIRDHAGADICDIVSGYVNLKPSGNGKKGCCPFHDEKTPSFYVHEKKEIYNCFGCEAGGDAIQFIMEIEGFTFKEAIFHLANRYNIAIDDTGSNQYREQLQQQNEIVPGIKELRGSIRKQNKVWIAFNNKGYKKAADNPVVLLKSPLKNEAAALLRKYASKCVLIVNDIRWKELNTSLKFTLQHGFSVTILHPGFNSHYEEDWINYIIPELGLSIQRKEIIQLLSIIPDDITRSVYTSHFIKNSTQKKRS